MTSNSGDYSIVQDNSTGKEKAKPKSKRQQDPRLSFIYPNSETVVAEKDLKNEIDATSKEEPKDVPSSLEDNASFLSSALYWYLNPLFKIGQTRVNFSTKISF